MDMKMDTQAEARLRILLCLLQGDPATCSVSGLSRSLMIEKYQVSRILAALEKEGLADRSDIHHPALTESGKEEAVKYRARVDLCARYLLSNGVGADSASRDAVWWSLINSEETMRMIRAHDAWERAKEELGDEKTFTGEELCRHLADGAYRLPFVMCREKVKDGESLSMANRGFYHPCVFTVQGGQGSVKLTAKTMRASSGVTKEWLSGKVRTLKYFSGGFFVEARKTGDIVEFPASALKFTSMGDGEWRALHGSVLLLMTASVGLAHMPAGRALFVLLL